MTNGREKAQSIAEFHLGTDCSCEQDSSCDVCRLAHDIEDAIIAAHLGGVRKGLEKAAVIAENFKGIGCVCSVDGINIADAIRSASKQKG